MKKKITRFEDMDVWKDSQEYAVLIYKATKTFPKEELYGITSQIRRSASSVSANIAEGFGRSTYKDRAHFYHIALGSLLETKNFVYLSGRLEYVHQEQVQSLTQQAENISNQITAIIRYLTTNA